MRHLSSMAVKPSFAAAAVVAALAAPPPADGGVVTIGLDSAQGSARAAACFQPVDASGNPAGESFCRSAEADSAGALFLGSALRGRASVSAAGGPANAIVGGAYDAELYRPATVDASASGGVPLMFPPTALPCPVAAGCRLLSGSASGRLTWLLEFIVSGNDVQIDREIGARGSPPLPALLDLTTGAPVLGEFATLTDGHAYRLTMDIGGGGAVPHFYGGSGMSALVGFRNATLRVPEPGSLALGMGAIAVAFAMVRRRRAPATGNSPP